MKIIYKPKTSLEKFGLKVLRALSNKSSQTFFVGGMVRDLLLKRNIIDVDITTLLKPDEIIRALTTKNVGHGDSFKNLGVILAKQGKCQVEITTFRKEVYGKNRFPKVEFITSPKIDSNRRDFTINALYLNLSARKILDYHNGLRDLKKHTIRFIGDPETRIQEDPLRIVRALRFALLLNSQLEQQTKRGIKIHFSQIQRLSTSKIFSEIDKITNKSLSNKLVGVINNPKLIDKYF